MNYISLSVHDLVDFVLRTGDIDSRYFNEETMQEGTRLHKKYQSEQGSSYTSEVYLSHEFIYDDYNFDIHGRCDGLIVKDDNSTPIIEELKTTNKDLEIFHKENEIWHLGQAQVYGLIYCLDNNLEAINLRLVYLSQVSKKRLIKNYKFTKETLVNIVNSFFDKYIAFLNVRKNFENKRDESLQKMCFPFNFYRKGQKELIDYTYNTISNKDISFAEASTGIGKSISVIYGSLEAMRDKITEKVFYLSAKNEGFNAANIALNILSKDGLRIKAVNIYSREKSCVCQNENKVCNPEICPFAKGYYTKLYDVLIYSLENYDIFTKEVFDELVDKFNICPFELSLDISTYCDFIICDYNYVFHPISYLQRFFADENIKKYKKSILVDEGHNLVDRTRDMYSAELSLSTILEALKEISKLNYKPLKRNIEKLCQIFKEYYNFFEHYEKEKQIQSIGFDLINVLRDFEDLYLNYKKKDKIQVATKYKNLSIDVFRFLKIYEFYSEQNYCINLIRDKNDLTLKLNCIDAATFIYPKLKMLYGSLIFSGTLTPFYYYADVILGNSDYKSTYFESPYSSENLRILVDNNISIRYKDRENTIEDVISKIESFVKPKIGNYMIFCPSFEYLMNFSTKILHDYRFKDCNFFIQNKTMKKEDRDIFLENFVENTTVTNIGICVLGGSFSEAISLENDRLIGTVIIGVGLPTFNLENRQLQIYFNKYKKGYDYAFIYPGISKIRQAIGRIIRSENDRGMALLIDDRYHYFSYSFLFNTAFKNYRFIKNKQEIEEEVLNFYKK